MLMYKELFEKLEYVGLQKNERNIKPKKLYKGVLCINKEFYYQLTLESSEWLKLFELLLLKFELKSVEIIKLKHKVVFGDINKDIVHNYFALTL